MAARRRVASSTTRSTGLAAKSARSLRTTADGRSARHRRALRTNPIRPSSGREVICVQLADEAEADQADGRWLILCLLFGLRARPRRCRRGSPRRGQRCGGQVRRRHDPVDLGRQGRVEEARVVGADGTSTPAASKRCTGAAPAAARCRGACSSWGRTDQCAPARQVGQDEALPPAHRGGSLWAAAPGRRRGRAAFRAPLQALSRHAGVLEPRAGVGRSRSGRGARRPFHCGPARRATAASGRGRGPCSRGAGAPAARPVAPAHGTLEGLVGEISPRVEDSASAGRRRCPPPAGGRTRLSLWRKPSTCRSRRRGRRRRGGASSRRRRSMR